MARLARLARVIAPGMPHERDAGGAGDDWERDSQKERAWEDLVTDRAVATPLCPSFARWGKTAQRDWDERAAFQDRLFIAPPLPWSVGEGSGPFGKEVRHGDLADDLAGNDQIGGVSLSEDRGGRVRASGRVGTDLELAADQVDDPVDGDAGPGIVVAILAAVPRQAAVRNLDDQGDIRRARMVIGVIVALAPDHGEVRFGLVVIRDSHRALDPNMPAGGEGPLDLSPAPRGAGVVSQSLGHLPHHNPVQELDLIILIDGAVAHHPVILIDGESVHFARGRERQRYGLSDRGHEVRSWVRATCPGGGSGTPISRTRRPTASECSTVPQGIQTDLQSPTPRLVPPAPRLFSRRITVEDSARHHCPG